MNEVMQQTLAGLPAHDRHPVREIRRLVDDILRIGAEMEQELPASSCESA